MAPHANGHDREDGGLLGRPEPAQSTFWRMRASTGRLLTCGLYETADGLELRAGFVGDDPMWTEPVPSEDFGVALAASWKAIVVGKGGFVDLDLMH